MPPSCTAVVGKRIISARAPSYLRIADATVQELGQADKPPLNILEGFWVRDTYVLKSLALVIFQYTVLSAEMAIAEAAVTNRVGGVLAAGGRTSDFLGSHSVVVLSETDDSRSRSEVCWIDL